MEVIFPSFRNIGIIFIKVGRLCAPLSLNFSNLKIMASPFGFFHSIQILKILIVTSFILQLGKSTEVIPAKPVRLRVGMCFPMDDPDRISLNITADLCDCSRHVVNCDFSKFNSTDVMLNTKIMRVYASIFFFRKQLLSYDHSGRKTLSIEFVSVMLPRT